MTSRAIIGVVMCASMASCTPVSSLHPVCTEGTQFFDARLCGVWCDDGDGDEGTVAVVRKGDGKSYVITIVNSRGESVTFKGHLARRDDTVLLDLRSSDEAIEKAAVVVLPAHLFLVVEEIRPKFRARGMDEAWLKDYLKKTPDALKHEIVDGHVLITASSDALQEFLIKHKGTGNAFLSVNVMVPMSRSSNKPDAGDGQ